MVLSFLKDLSSKWNFPYACPKRADSSTGPAKLNKKTNVCFYLPRNFYSENTSSVFSVHTTPVEFEDTIIIIGLVFGENSSREITSFSLCCRFQKAPFFISVDGRPNVKNKAACF